MKGKRILIVEDEAIIALELEMRLQIEGFNDIKIVSTGQQAIDLTNEKEFNLILMDIILKGQMDGIEAARQINKNHSIPIIYVTGNSDYKTDKRLLATRPIDVLIKPVASWQLFKIIKQTLTSSN